MVFVALAMRVAANPGNAILGTFCVSICGSENKSGNIPILPLEELCRCFLCFQCRVCFERVDNEFIEFLM